MSGSMGSSASPGSGLLSVHSTHASSTVSAADAAFLQDSGLGGSFVSSTSSSSRGSYGGSSLSDRASVSSSSQSGGSGGMGGLGIPPLPSNPPPVGYHSSYYYSDGSAYRGSTGPGSASYALPAVNKLSFVTSNNNCESTVPTLGIPIHSSPQQPHLNNSLNSRMYESGIPMTNNMCSRDVCPDLLLRSPSVDPMRRDFPHSRSGSIDTTRNDFPHHRSGSIDTTRNEFPPLRSGSIDTSRGDFPHHRSTSIDASRNDLPHHRSGSIDTSRSDFPHSRSGSIDTTRSNLPHFRSGSGIDASSRGEYPHPRSGSIDSTYRSNFHQRTGSTDTTGRPVDFRRSGSIDAPAGRSDYLSRRAGAGAAATAGSVDEDLPQVAGGAAAAEGGAGDEVLRESFMIKRSQNRSRFGPTNWRERWFLLTPSNIIYYDGDRQSGRKKEKGRVDLSSVECVERVDDSAFDREHVFQIVHVIDGEESCTLYIEAATQHDCTAWIHHIRQLVCENTGLQSLYHPGRPLRGLWSCCKSANPCTPITWVPAARGASNTAPASHSSPTHSVNTPPPQNFHTPTHSLHTSQTAHTSTHSLHSTLSAHTPTHSIHSSHSVHTSPLPHSPSSVPGHPGSPQGCSSPAMLGAAQLNGANAPLTAGVGAPLSNGLTADMPQKRMVRAMYDYKAAQKGDLSLVQDEEYEVLEETEEHWWKLRDKHGNEGYSPSNYVKEATDIGLHQYDWYLGDATRQRAETILMREEREGCFVVRNSSSTTGMYTISVYCSMSRPQVKHYHIQKDSEGKYYLSHNIKCNSISELIYKHQYNPGGLCTRLRSAPLGNKPPATAGFSRDKWDIPLNEITLLEEIGSGQFGVVRRGKYRGMDVAVKMMKEGTMSEDEFIEEAKVMTKLQHPNLVQLYGVCKRQRPVYIITEFLEYGSLLHYLRQKEKVLSAKTDTLIDMCLQICEGMAYLEKEKFIHRDLAARNCLVGSKNIKVGDFGLARYVVDDEYTGSGGAKFPIKWAAPEVLNYMRFSSKSDVWAFGVLMWEVFTCGKMPYGRRKNADVVAMVQEGIVLDQPRYCPHNVYQVMRECWEQSADQRPSFHDLKTEIGRLNAED